MKGPLENFALWASTLGLDDEHLAAPREVLRQSYLSFRERVATLVSTLGAELPGLTVHDITHLDGLWRVAHEIAGPGYGINPAEAYVLGGAFLLHDAAHVVAAYPGGVREIRETTQWQDLIAQRYGGSPPQTGTPEATAAMFQTLRQLHAEQAHRLATIAWTDAVSGVPMFLIENHGLRTYYGDAIGEVAASHHWPAHVVAERFRERRLNCPAFLSAADWEVDLLKVALLLRTADAAHLDDSRAPWFLFALRKPQGISAAHWHFQAKLGQPKRTARGELKLSSGSRFGPSERSAWWLAFETARMVDRELKDANAILKEEGREPFAATTVLGIESPQSFAKHVPVSEWEPIDIAPRIADAAKVIATLGGSALYGDEPAAALRELLQNALDAVRAARSLGYIGPSDGVVRVSVQPADTEAWWLTVADTGIGMSRHVLANVLLDFGNSLWTSDALREELPGLAKSNFRAVGKFGIGFFSVFMLGDQVRVSTRRLEPGKDGKIHWQLQFDHGLDSRPALLRPPQGDALLHAGTTVAVKIRSERLARLLEGAPKSFTGELEKMLGLPRAQQGPSESLLVLLRRLCPTSPVQIETNFHDAGVATAVSANDWLTLTAGELCGRIGSSVSHLVPLVAANGDLLGRLTIDIDVLSAGAAVTHQGLVCGRVPSLSGVVAAKANSSDAQRTRATPAGTIAEWRAWAERRLKMGGSIPLEARERLHPLVPELDLNVWRMNQREQTLTEILETLSEMDEVLLYAGEVSREDYDDISEDRFGRDFEPIPELVCCPHMRPQDPHWLFSTPGLARNSRGDFPWFLSVKPIDYAPILVNGLSSIWKEVEEDEVDVVVGHVDDFEVHRLVTRYTRGQG